MENQAKKFNDGIWRKSKRKYLKLLKVVLYLRTEKIIIFMRYLLH